MIYINREDSTGRIKTVGNAKTAKKANKLLSEFEFEDHRNTYFLSNNKNKR